MAIFDGSLIPQIVSARKIVYGSDNTTVLTSKSNESRHTAFYKSIVCSIKIYTSEVRE